MAKNEVKITVTAKDNASKNLKDVNKSLGELGDNAESAGGGLEGFADNWSMMLLGINQGIQIVKMAGEALEKAFDLSYQGAQVAQTEEAFGSLTRTIELGADVINEWSDATGNTISDLKLMAGFQTLVAGTSKEMTSAFADNNAQLLKIAKAASALNPTLGDTAHMYQSITTGIKRSSPLILDNLGLVVKVGDANEKMAKSLGKSVDALSAEEKQMALLNAVLEKGDTLIDQLGGKVEAITDPWEHFTAAVENTKNEMLEETTIIGGLIDAIADLLDATNDESNALELASDTLERLEKQGLLTAEMAAELRGQILYTKDGVYAVNEALEGFEESLGGTEWGLAANAAAAGDLGTALDGIDDIAITAEEAMRNYSDTLLFNIASQDKSEEASLALAQAMGLTDQKTMNAIASMQNINAEFAKTGDIQKMIDSVLELQAALDGLPSSKSILVNVKTVTSDPFASEWFEGQIGEGTKKPEAVGGIVHGMAHAAGGYIVGEVGPEPFFPAQDGRIMSHSDAMTAMRGGARGGGAVVNVTINTPINLADEMFVQEQLAPYILEAFREERVSEYL